MTTPETAAILETPGTLSPPPASVDQRYVAEVLLVAESFGDLFT